MSQEGEGQGHDKSRNRLGQGHGSSILRYGGDARAHGQGTARARRLDFTVRKRHASAPWIFSECALNAHPERTLDSPPPATVRLTCGPGDVTTMPPAMLAP